VLNFLYEIVQVVTVYSSETSCEVTSELKQEINKDIIVAFLIATENAE
jgi:hypothetical protein